MTPRFAPRVLMLFVAITALLLMACSRPLPGESLAEPTETSTAPTKTAPAEASPTRESTREVTATSSPDERALNLTLVGSLRLDPVGRGAHADVAAYNDLALVGSRCTGAGVHIIDISDPTKPEKLANTPESENTSMEDMQVMRIGERDVLVIGFQNCADPDEAKQGLEGIELVDISNPARPRHLSLFATEGGVHELDLGQSPDGRTLALLAIPEGHEEPDGETHTTPEDGQAGLVIVDISDPTTPVLASQWDLLDEPTLGEAVQQGSARGTFPRAFLHSVRASEDGTLAYLSYWDAGVILLDITTPESPRYLGRTTFADEEEGNAHSVSEAAEGRILIQAQEDFSPYGIHISSPALESPPPLVEIGRWAEIAELPDGRLEGEVVHVGRGCFEDEPLAEPDGKLALIARGGCGLGEKIAVAQEAGAIAAILYEAEDGEPDEADGLPGAGVTLPDGTRVALEIPTFLNLEEGRQRLVEAAPLSLRIESPFDGYGDLRFYDISDPANPALLGTFASANTFDEEMVGSGVWSAHNAEIVGNTLYASWYSDGIRVVDITDPAQPREIAFWGGMSGSRLFVWGVVPHNDLILASDMGYGLYILRHEP